MSNTNNALYLANTYIDNEDDKCESIVKIISKINNTNIALRIAEKINGYEDGGYYKEQAIHKIILHNNDTEEAYKLIEMCENDIEIIEIYSMITNKNDLQKNISLINNIDDETAREIALYHSLLISNDLILSLKYIRFLKYEYSKVRVICYIISNIDNLYCSFYEKKII